MNFSSYLERFELLTGDAAMGSQLIARGLPNNIPGELWNVDQPDVIQQIQESYVEAGACHLIANTFGANPISLARHDLAERTEEIIAAGVRNARQAGEDDTVVFGDMGPCGELIQPLGTLSEQDAQAAFARQASALEEAGADTILAETFESSNELNLALTAAREATSLPLLASMKFDAQDDGKYRSVMGDAPTDLIRIAEDNEVVAVGTNCGQGIKTMSGLVEHLADLTNCPLIAQPNAGKPRLEGDQTVYEEGPEEFAAYLPALYEAGAKIIGGCCGTTADHIRAIRRFADSL